MYEYTAQAAFDINIAIGDQQLQGRLQGGVSWEHDGSVGLLHYYASNLKGSHICALWLAHLIGSAAGVLSGQSLLVAKDKERRLAAIEPAAARDKLMPWMDGWNRGQSQALPFFVKTSAILAGAVKGNAKSAWLPASFNGPPGESEQEAVQLLYDNIANLHERQDVIDWAVRLLGDEVLSA